MRGIKTVMAVLLACAAIAGGGCGRSETYRYKLTLSVETQDGIKTAHAVGKVRHGEVSFPARGVSTSLTGEALYLDLGRGARPLVALLTRRDQPMRPLLKPHWDENVPTQLLARLYEEQGGDLLDKVSRFSRRRGAKEITSRDLPDLVTFADVSDPKSVMAVDRDDLAATLGSGVRWHKITLEVTDEPLTTGIHKRLGWLQGLNGSLGKGMKLPYDHLLNRINDGSFRQGMGS